MGRRLGQLIHDQLRTETHITAQVLALPPGHAYLRLPLQFSASLRPRLLQLVSETELDGLEAAAARELADPSRWGTTFTLIQASAAASTSRSPVRGETRHRRVTAPHGDGHSRTTTVASADNGA